MVNCMDPGGIREKKRKASAGTRTRRIQPQSYFEGRGETATSEVITPGLADFDH
jgi:hypothetical protein